MINKHKQWLYSKEHGGKIFEVGVEINGEWYDSPDFDSPKTVMVGDVEATELKEVTTKYPSQMNKDELLEKAALLGVEIPEDATRKDMIKAITDYVKST